jgi:YhcH/YjgK/YiaL family protein
MHRNPIFRLVWGGVVACIVMSSLTGCCGNKKNDKDVERDHMIIDTLDNAERYYDLHPAFAQALAFLSRSDLAQLPAERHDIDGDRLFCAISKGPGRPRAEASLEAHRKYVDIQYVIAGAEEMGWKPTAECRTVKTPYDADKDIEFFEDTPETWTDVPPGSFVIFFPEDAHAPLVGEGQIHKAVLKIAVE